MSRRFHLRVSAKHYLRCLLKLGPATDDGGTDWFTDSEMQQLMAIIHEELPLRLPPLLERPNPTASHPEIVRGDSIQVCLTFIPNATKCWLLCEGEKETQPDGAAAAASSSSKPPSTPRAGLYPTSYTAVEYTLLLNVEPFRANSSDPQRMKTAPPDATLAQKELTRYFQPSS
jgi:hypothetical protein